MILWTLWAHIGSHDQARRTQAASEAGTGAYRRADLARWSTSVDRHLKELVESGTLKKLSGGLYVYQRRRRSVRHRRLTRML